MNHFSSRYVRFALVVQFALILLPGCKNEREASLEEGAPREEIKQAIWIDGPAGKLFVDRGGAGGLPVVIVHSLAGNAAQWRAQLEHLRPSRLAVAFDMRGHGRSQLARDRDYSLEAMAQDLAAVADSLGLQKFVLIGHSYGGGVIATYAGRHPERVAGLLFADPIGDVRGFPKQEIDEWLAAMRSEGAIERHWRAILSNADSAVAKTVIAGLRQTPPAVVLSAFASMVAFDPVAVLQPYHGPMQTIVSGLPDSPAALHHALPHLPRAAMPGTSHWLQMDRPEEFNRLMDEFLHKLGAR